MNCWRLSNSLNVPDSKFPAQVTLPDGCARAAACGVAGLPVEETSARPRVFAPFPSAVVLSAYVHGATVFVARRAPFAQNSTEVTSPEVVTDQVDVPERVAPDWMLLETRAG